MKANVLDNLQSEKVRSLIKVILKSKKCTSEDELYPLIDKIKELVPFSHWFVAIYETTESGKPSEMTSFGNFSKRWIYKHRYQDIQQNQETLIFANTDLKNWIEGRKDFNFKLYRELFLNKQYNCVGDYFYLFEFQKNMIEKYVFSFFDMEPMSDVNREIIHIVTPFLCETIASIRTNIQKKILTPRQTEILKIIQFGFSRKEVAEKINSTEANVKYHLNQTFRRLKVTNQASAVRKALLLRLLED